MEKYYPVNLAKGLRRNETEPEQIVWSWLRNRQMEGVKFRRQQPIGNYIVDFVSFERKLIIEVDGGQHNKTLLAQQDEQRTKWLKSEGFHVLRFWNNEVKENPEGVFLRIAEVLRCGFNPMSS
jgi:very-short-patch-repair endonuclease